MTDVRALVRRSTGVQHPKLREIVHADYLDYSAVAGEFAGVDACYFCLGVSVSQVPDEAALSAHSPGSSRLPRPRCCVRRVRPRSFTT